MNCVQTAAAFLLLLNNESGPTPPREVWFWITNTGDFIVTNTGDNLVFYPGNR